MCPTVSGYSESLVNRNSSVSDAAKGLRSGSIVRAGQSWSSTETQAPLQPPSPEPVTLPELTIPPEAAELAFDSNLEGQWQGTGREQADFQPSQLAFGLREKSQRFEFSQSLKQDLKSASATIPEQGKAGEGSYTAGHLSLTSTAQIKDELGKEWLALEQSFSASDSGEQARSGLARYQATQALQVSGAWSSNPTNQSRSLGVSYQPSTEEAPDPLSLSLQTTYTETAEQKKEAQNLLLQYDQSHLTYAQERSKPIQTTMAADSTAPQTMQEFGIGSTIQTLSFGLTQRETTAEFLNLDAQTAFLNWQVNESSQIQLNHSREVLNEDSLPTTASESNQITLKYSFDPETSGELSYLNKSQVSELFTGKWSDSQWEGAFERERNHREPSLSQTRYQLSYASQSLQEKPLALECRVSLVERPNGKEWDGNLRIYGTDLKESAFEASLNVASNTPPTLKVNYNQDF